MTCHSKGRGEKIIKAITWRAACFWNGQQSENTLWEKNERQLTGGVKNDRYPRGGKLALQSHQLNLPKKKTRQKCTNTSMVTF